MKVHIAAVWFAAGGWCLGELMHPDEPTGAFATCVGVCIAVSIFAFVRAWKARAR